MLLQPSTPSSSKRKRRMSLYAETNLREEKEIILDDICADMRKGLSLGVSTFIPIDLRSAFAIKHC
jgi:hypothetical protein